ncbi:MAG: glutamate racemase [Capsulimonadaceae bacterium]
MKIGIFDSGLGGLLITHSIIRALPDYDYIYLGDTARVPYGTRSREVIFHFARQAVDFLFHQDCNLIVVACNTASADALRRIQQEYLPSAYPSRRVLGVLIPAAEESVAVTPSGRIGVLATQATVGSGAFLREIHKLNPHARIIQRPAPLLVPLIEMDGIKYAKPILADYLEPFDGTVDTVILGCTHYPVMRGLIADGLGPDVRIVDQNEVVPGKLTDYLRRHPEIEAPLTRGGTRRYLVTDLTASAESFANQLFHGEIALTPIPAFI